MGRARGLPMSSNGKNPSKILKWRLECLAHSVVEGMAGCLPGPAVYRIGEMLGSLACAIMPQRRKTVMRNLRIAFAGEKDGSELHDMMKQTFRRSGGNLISAAHTSRLSPEQLAEVMTIQNFQLLLDALSEGKGVVLLLSHMGNWEVLSRMIHLFPKGAKTGAFYRPLNNPLLDERVLARRQADGTRMFSKRDNPLHVAAFLREGGIVGILADQRVGPKGELTEFFGRMTRASPLPALLARRAKATVLSLAVTTDRPGRWTATFMPVESPQHTAQCMVALEKAMKSGPLDVFWLQERWKVYLGKNLTVRQWLGEDSSRSRKAHRALLWLVDVSNSWVLPAEWQHPDVCYELALAESQPIPESVYNDIIIHRVPRGNDLSQVKQAISKIDASAALPLDFILVPQGNAALAKAAKQETIPLVSLS